MLPEPLRLLIAAYAADDLSPSRRKAAVRLLKHSREARQLLRGLNADRERLQNLPKAVLPSDIADRVLAQLPAPSPEARPVTRRTVRGFSPAHVAASVAVAVAFGAVGWTMLSLNGSRPNGRTSPHDIIASKVDAPVVVAVPLQPTATNDLEPDPSVEIPPSVPVPNSPPPAALPKPAPRDVLTAPAATRIETVHVKPPRLTLVVPAHRLDASESQTMLAHDFDLGQCHRIDLFARDTPRGFDRLQAVLHDQGVRLSVETVAAEVHKLRNRNQTYVVFCEDLTAKEWVGILRRLGAVDRRAEENKAGDGQFEAVALMALAPNDQKDLTGLFGTDVTQPIADTKSADVDVRKPIADSTAQHVVEALDKVDRGRKPGDKTAIVLSGSNIRATPSTSREVKQFRDGLREPPEGRVSVMRGVRPAK